MRNQNQADRERPSFSGIPAIQKRTLANLESAKFNSLEIMRVASEASKRFLGVRYVTVSAQSRHIQESAFLFGAKDLPVKDRARSAAA